VAAVVQVGSWGGGVFGRYYAWGSCNEPVTYAESITEYRTRAKLIVAPGGKLGLYAKAAGTNIVGHPMPRALPALAQVTEGATSKGRAMRKSAGRSRPRTRGNGVVRAVDLREVREKAEGPARVTSEGGGGGGALVLQRSKGGRTSTQCARPEAEWWPRRPSVGVAANFQEGEEPQIRHETVVLRGATRADRSATPRTWPPSALRLIGPRDQGARVQPHAGWARFWAALQPAPNARPRVLDFTVDRAPSDEHGLGG